MTDPTILSLDIETYGACLQDANGTPLPTQRESPRNMRADPWRASHFDKPSNLILTCAITLPTEDPRSSPSQPWTIPLLSQLTPGPTMVLQLPAHASLLRRWLAHADTILGMNLQFDLLFLRHSYPELRYYSYRHTLIDLGVLVDQENPVRTERSLKSLGPVLGTHIYKDTLAHKRFPSPLSPQHISYNAQDTHNTLLSIAEISRRIVGSYPSTSAKHAPFLIRYFSDLAHSTIRMSEAGVPFSLPSLQSLESEISSRIRDHQTFCAKHGIYLTAEVAKEHGGKCKQSQLEYFTDLLRDFSLLDHPRLLITPKKNEISLSEPNLTLLLDHLPSGITAHNILSRWIQHLHDQKLLGSYIYPYLRHKRTDPTNRTSALVPSPPARSKDPSVHLSHPRWYLNPSPYKDGTGGDGGTQQVRITCKGGAHQTDPVPIQKCRASRFIGGSLISYDADQAELRTPVVLSGDTSLAEALDSGDIHTTNTLRIFGEDSLISKYGENYAQHPTFRSTERQVGKMVGLADSFRSGAATMQRQVYAMTGIEYPLSLFQEIVENRSKDRPQLYAWQEARIAEARRQGYLEVPFIGTHRFFNPRPSEDEWDENAIVNLQVQAFTAAAISRLGCLIDRRLHTLPSPPALLFLNVYDALKFDCRPHRSDDLHEIFTESLEELHTTDLWGMLQQQTGHEYPLTFSREPAL